MKKDRDILICTRCGNTHSFKGIANETIYYRKVLFDRYGEIIDIGDSNGAEIDHTDIDRCAFCDSLSIITMSESELDEYVYKHTRKDTTWSEDELPLEERNKELLDKLIVDKI
jgi:hypothetical protein